MKNDFGKLIEKYLEGELKSSEAEKVENLIKSDKKFANEFMLRKDLNEFLKNKIYIDFYMIFKNIFKKKTGYKPNIL